MQSSISILCIAVVAALIHSRLLALWCFPTKSRISLAELSSVPKFSRTRLLGTSFALQCERGATYGRQIAFSRMIHIDCIIIEPEVSKLKERAFALD